MTVEWYERNISILRWIITEKIDKQQMRDSNSRDMNL